MDARVDGLGLGSIQEINALPRKMAEALYLRLVPDDLLQRFAIDPATFRGRDGGRLVRITAPEGKPWVRVEVRQAEEDRDPALLVDVETSPLSVPELAFVQINDPTAPRYAIDSDVDGLDTLFGTASRNLAEELRAMQDGLAPGQVRRGLRAGAGPGVMEPLLAHGQGDLLIDPLFLPLGHPLRTPWVRLSHGREAESIHEGFGQVGLARAARRLLLPPTGADALCAGGLRLHGTRAILGRRPGVAAGAAGEHLSDAISGACHARSRYARVRKPIPRKPRVDPQDRLPAASQRQAREAEA